MGVCAVVSMLMLGAVACGDDDSDTENDATDVVSTEDVAAEVGTVEVSGSWAGAFPEGAFFRVFFFGCLLSMPPNYYFDSPIAENGDVLAIQEEVDAGEWCLMAYVDMDPDDGLAPVVGLDPVNTTGDENDEGALMIHVVTGETTVVPLTFDIR